MVKQQWKTPRTPSESSELVGGDSGEATVFVQEGPWMTGTLAGPIVDSARHERSLPHSLVNGEFGRGSKRGESDCVSAWRFSGIMVRLPTCGRRRYRDRPSPGPGREA